MAATSSSAQAHSRSTASLSLHVLDTTRGRPGSNMRVELDEAIDASNEQFVRIGHVSTDANGRAPRWEALKAPHVYRLTFATADYFRQEHGEKTFYPHVRVLFEVQPGEHFHVPLLVSAFGYSTYRGN